jgi:hypothetical protein
VSGYLHRILGGALKTAGGPYGAGRHVPTAAAVARGCIAALAVAILYFLAAQLGHALMSAPSDLAVFWPASGIAAGILIVLGRRRFQRLSSAW